LDRQELDEKLVFKTGAKVDLGLKDPTRKVIHQGEVSRKSDNKLEWLDIHLILLDNFLIMTKKRRDRNGEKYFVSKQVLPSSEVTNSGYSCGFISFGRCHWGCSFETQCGQISWYNDHDCQRTNCSTSPAN
jgi:hypothetical protein